MRQLDVRIAGAARPVYVVETFGDSGHAAEALWSSPYLAVDTETTGLDIYSKGFKLRVVQVGTKDAAYVFPVEDHYWGGIISDVLRHAKCLVMHNATFDLLVLDNAGLLDLEEGWAKTVDTRILAHLLDPRTMKEGGIGHGLKQLSAAYFDQDAPDSQKELKAVFKANKWTVAEGFTKIPIDHPEFLRYAGADVILTSWLFEALRPVIVGEGLSSLSDFEHEVARICSVMQRRGLLVDQEYASGLVDYYLELETNAVFLARSFGIHNVNSTAQVASVLQALGVNLYEKTPSGLLKVDKAVLEGVINNGGAASEVAQAVLNAKNASKWSQSYVQATLESLDSAGRCHPSINSLQARTARMSISNPPLQQLPSGDWRVRRMFVADPGQLIVAADYAQVEMRVLAALANEKKMLEAFKSGEDLHDTTAKQLFGSDFTKAQRKLAKNTGFGKVYGGGAATLARQAGVSPAEAKAVIDRYDRVYPGVKRYARKLVEKAEWGKREVVTPSGRRLPLDKDRIYAATNYVVQSTARDVLAQALLDLDEAGLTKYLLIPVHDEVIAQAPTGEADDVVRAIQDVMGMDFMGKVFLQAEGEVYGPSWGHGYGAPS